MMPAAPSGMLLVVETVEDEQELEIQELEVGETVEEVIVLLELLEDVSVEEDEDEDEDQELVLLLDSVEDELLNMLVLKVLEVGLEVVVLLLELLVTEVLDSLLERVLEKVLEVLEAMLDVLLEESLLVELVALIVELVELLDKVVLTVLLTVAELDVEEVELMLTELLVESGATTSMSSSALLMSQSLSSSLNLYFRVRAM